MGGFFRPEIEMAYDSGFALGGLVTMGDDRSSLPFPVQSAI
jgi:hypothetical protein